MSSTSTTTRTFPSWTFSHPCTKMEWNTVGGGNGGSTTKTQLLAGNTSIENADLVVIGIFVPSTDPATVSSSTLSKELFHSATSIQKIDQGLNYALTDLYEELQDPNINNKKKNVMSKVGSISSVYRSIQPKTSTSTTAAAVKKRYVLLSLGPSWLDTTAATTTTTTTSTSGTKGTRAATSAVQQLQQQQMPTTTMATASTTTTTTTTTSAGTTTVPIAIGFSIGKAIASISIQGKKVVTVCVHLPDTIVNNHTILRDISTSFYTELYRDHRYRSSSKEEGGAKDSLLLSTVYIRCEDSTVSQDTISLGYSIAHGVYLTKDIINAPHNVLNSISLSETAQRIVSTVNSTQSNNNKNNSCTMKCTILNEHECEALGMGAYLGVARGSETPPQFIHISCTTPLSSSSSKRRSIGFVGKGLLFDTGGYNIKTQMMELMKFDCGGAAAVLGAAYALGLLVMGKDASLVPNDLEIHFIVAACENMINEKAIVPSDILIASNGKTIEIINTDAEGRLTLADALVYADKQCKCDTIIELSTLTGACMVSLGKEICGMWTHNDAIAEELSTISKITQDKLWRMPLATEYEEQIQSKIADLQNLGGKYGGSITAALFLQHFVDPDKVFVHLDIAGPAWDDKIGATGYGTKLILEYIMKQGK